MVYVIIENTPGYLPEDDDPFVTDDYDEAVAYLNQIAAEREAEGLRVEYGVASSANLAAILVHDGSSEHDLGRYIGIEVDES